MNIDTFTVSTTSVGDYKASNENGYESLAIAIVVQALKDYKRSYTAGTQNSYCKSIERFLRESWIGDFFINLDLVSLAKELATTIDEEDEVIL